MLSNDTFTVYHLNGNQYERRVIPACFFYWSSAMSATPTGTVTTDTARVIIPYTAQKPVVDDIVVRGVCSAVIDNSGERTQAASVKALRKSHSVYTVVSVAENRAGSRQIWHYDCQLR